LISKHLTGLIAAWLGRKLRFKSGIRAIVIAITVFSPPCRVPKQITGVFDGQEVVKLYQGSVRETWATGTKAKTRGGVQTANKGQIE
jgi:hypothetical protein